MSSNGLLAGVQDASGTDYLVNTTTGHSSKLPAPSKSLIRSVNNLGDAILSNAADGTIASYISYFYHNGTLIILAAPDSFLKDGLSFSGNHRVVKETLAMSLNDQGDIAGYVLDQDGLADGFLYQGGISPFTQFTTGHLTANQALTQVTDEGTFYGTDYGVNYVYATIGTTHDVVGDVYMGHYVFTNPPTYSTVSSVSRNGQFLVGLYGTYTGQPPLDFDAQAYYKTPTGLVYITPTHGGTISFPEFGSINNTGLAVGEEATGTGTSSRKTYPFIFDGKTKTDLSALVPANSGWVLTSGVAVANNDSLIGTGTHNGAPTVFITGPAPVVAITSLTWNTDRNGTLANADHRGVDFAYSVTGTIPENMSIPIDFYWATSTDPRAVIAQTASDSHFLADSININTVLGAHGHGTSEPFDAGNDPARWGTPPPSAKYVVAIIDPDQSLGETDAPSESNGRLAYLQLPSSISDVLQNSVIAAVDTLPPKEGITSPVGDVGVRATFNPGIGTGDPMPLSEAEVYLGVDHFNWIQTFVTPRFWTNYKLINLDMSKFSFHVGDKVVSTNIVELYDNEFYYVDAHSMPDFFSMIPYVPLSTAAALLDPIVQTYPGIAVNYATIFNIVDAGVGRAYPVFGSSDQYPYYFDETTAHSGKPGELNDYTFAYTMDYSDFPAAPYIESPFRSNSYQLFNTRLVGVNYEPATSVDYNEYSGTSFTWKSNVTLNGAGENGNVVLAKNLTPFPASDYATGQVAIVPNAAASPPLTWVHIEPIATQMVVAGQPFARYIIVDTLGTSAPLTYRIASGSLVGATVNTVTQAIALKQHIDINSGVLSLCPFTSVVGVPGLRSVRMQVHSPMDYHWCRR